MNDEPLLSVEYADSERTETLYSRSRDRLLTIRYDQSGRQVRAIPAGPLDGLNISYDAVGRVSGWWRGDTAVSNVYDERSGLLVEHKVNGKISRRFIYKTGNKVGRRHQSEQRSGDPMTRCWLGLRGDHTPGLWPTAIRRPSLQFNGLRPRNPCNHVIT